MLFNNIARSPPTQYLLPRLKVSMIDDFLSDTKWWVKFAGISFYILNCTDDWRDGKWTFQFDDGSILMFHPKLSLIVLHYQLHQKKILLQFSPVKCSASRNSLNGVFHVYDFCKIVWIPEVLHPFNEIRLTKSNWRTIHCLEQQHHETCHSQELPQRVTGGDCINIFYFGSICAIYVWFFSYQPGPLQYWKLHFVYFNLQYYIRPFPAGLSVYQKGKE